MKEAVAAAIAEHWRAGRPVHVWKNGRVVALYPDGTQVPQEEPHVQEQVAPRVSRRVSVEEVAAVQAVGVVLLAVTALAGRESAPGTQQRLALEEEYSQSRPSGLEPGLPLTMKATATGSEEPSTSLTLATAEPSG